MGEADGYYRHAEPGALELRERPPGDGGPGGDRHEGRNSREYRTMSRAPRPSGLDLHHAADVVELPETALAALAGAGYVAADQDPGGERTFQLPDLKAFVARNADNGTGGVLPPPPPVADLEPAADLEPEELVGLLDERAEHMALRMLKMYATVFPQVVGWSEARQAKFVVRTKARFEAILAVAALGDSIAPELVEDLRAIGHSAARHGVELPQVLTMLRVSRDLVVQNAIELAEDGERHGGHALSLLLTRILPAMDRLGDALTEGYWAAVAPGRASG
jgi:hypothetical protein